MWLGESQELSGQQATCHVCVGQAISLLLLRDERRDVRGLAQGTQELSGQQATCSVSVGRAIELLLL